MASASSQPTSGFPIGQIIPKVARDMGKNDVAFTFHMVAKDFTIYDEQTFLRQINLWKTSGNAQVLSCNIRRVRIGRKIYWLFVVQPKDLEQEIPMCPTAMAFGIMVSGFGYITDKKKIVQSVYEDIGVSVGPYSLMRTLNASPRELNSKMMAML